MPLKKKEDDDLDLWENEKFSDDEHDVEEDIKLQNLKKSVAELSGRKRHTELRTESTTNIAAIKSLNKVSLGDLINTDAKPDKELVDLKKNLTKQNVLETPLPRAEHEKIRRLIGYDEAVKTMTSWEPVVHANRKVKQMNFPLVQPDVKVIEKANIFAREQKPRTRLELAVAGVLNDNKEHLIDKKPLSAFEERALQAMSLEEAKARRAELQKQRALMSFYGAKMKRQGKIKSKRYHRILRKSRQKAEEKKLEVLKDKDPEAYQEWLFKEERRRIEERMTLKHKGGSKLMKRQAKYGKYNSESRQAIQDMIQKGKELSAKREDSSSGDDDKDDDGDAKDVQGQKHEEINNKNKYDDDDDDEGDDEEEDDAEEDDNNNDDDDDDDDEKINENDDDDDKDQHVTLDEKLVRKKTLEDMDAICDEGGDGGKHHHDNDDDDTVNNDDDDTANNEHDDDDDDGRVRKRKMDFIEVKRTKKRRVDDASDINVIPSHFLKIGQDTEPTTAADHTTDHTTANKTRTIEEAMADDDVIVEFMEEKKMVEERDKVKDIDMTLPGWGEWTGVGIQVSKRKRKRFTIRAPKGPPRKDSHMNAVIISELKDEAIAKHQVSSLPWQHKNVHEFQKSIKQPIGKQWNREDVYRKKIMPKNFIKMGHIIEPIDKSDVFNKLKKSTFNNLDAGQNKNEKNKFKRGNFNNGGGSGSKKHKKHK